jgi:hypothetical protein
MKKIGRNAPCPCGSGEKYKRCCAQKDTTVETQKVATGQFRYESGSYGDDSKGYMPSILGYRELGSDSRGAYLCLVNPETVLEDENEASAVAEKHLAAALTILSKGGNAHDFALSLEYIGYVKVSDFKIAED